MYIFKLILYKELQKANSSRFQLIQILCNFTHLLAQYSPYNQLQIEQ